MFGWFKKARKVWEPTQEEIEWAKSILRPTRPELDEKDHEIAKLRFVIDHMYIAVMELHFYMGGHPVVENPINHEQALKRLGELIYGDDEENPGFPIGTEPKEIEDYARYHEWDYYRDQFEHGTHCGDCTAVAASCCVCRAECFYDQTDHSWSKPEGSRALGIISWLDKQKEKSDED